MFLLHYHHLVAKFQILLLVLLHLFLQLLHGLVTYSIDSAEPLSEVIHASLRI